MRARLFVVVSILLVGCVSSPDTSDARLRFDAIHVETSLGSFTAIFFPNETPATLAFMKTLVDAKYYDGRSFGRVIPGFVIQEVDRTGGTTDQQNKVKLEAPRNVSFSAGAFGVARDADPNSGSSEFFVMDFAYSSLYGNYTAFAQVVEGLDVVHAIARVPAVNTAGGVGSPVALPVAFGIHDRVPVQPVVMTRVTMITYDLPLGEAARYPLQVGDTVRGDGYRATLEWPRNLQAGATSDLTWYVWAREAGPTAGAKDPEAMDLSGARVVIDGETHQTNEEAKTPGVLHFSWRPTSSGNHTIRLVRDGTDLAATTVTIP